MTRKKLQNIEKINSVFHSGPTKNEENDPVASSHGIHINIYISSTLLGNGSTDLANSVVCFHQYQMTLTK